MKLIEDLLESVTHLDCPVRRACVGLYWTVVESRHTGMAHTYKTNRKVEPEFSGQLTKKTAFELALRLRSWEPLECSLGLAALNSLIDPSGSSGNILEHICEIAVDKTVTVVGRFPSNNRIAQVARTAHFLEMDPNEGELPSNACEEVIPGSDIVLVTATALINKTLPRLLELSQHATTVVLGPSTPMNDVLFRYGVDIISGVRVTNPDALFGSVAQGVKKFGKLEGIEPINRYGRSHPCRGSGSTTITRSSGNRHAGYVSEDRLKASKSFAVFSTVLGKTFKINDAATIRLFLTPGNVTDTHQRDLDKGPCRYTGYVYGPTAMRQVSPGMTWEF